MRADTNECKTVGEANDDCDPLKSKVDYYNNEIIIVKQKIIIMKKN